MRYILASIIFLIASVSNADDMSDANTYSEGELFIIIENYVRSGDCTKSYKTFSSSQITSIIKYTETYIIKNDVPNEAYNEQWDAVKKRISEESFDLGDCDNLKEKIRDIFYKNNFSEGLNTFQWE